MGQPTGIGVIGLGVISRAYLDTLVGHPDVAIVAVADLDEQRARDAAAAIPGARALPVEQLLAAPEVEIVLNLTIPAAHADIALAALAAGKAVYGEKPLAVSFDDASTVARTAREAGLALGGAPDTVLGTGVQTARAAIEHGLIGRPTSATATWVSAGHERWHPHPDFYYRPGGGPLLDMGPYYLTSLVHLLGPVVAVTGASSRPRGSRVIGSGPRAGQAIPVETDTHVTGVLEHASGALSTVLFSFDAPATEASPLEVHGEGGSLVVPDPNLFAGEVRLRASADADPSVLAPAAGYVDAARGVGLLDLVWRGGDAARASGSVALHVTETMVRLLDSAAEGRRLPLETTPVVPDLVPLTPPELWRAPHPSRP